MPLDNSQKKKHTEIHGDGCKWMRIPHGVTFANAFHSRCWIRRKEDILGVEKGADG